MKTIKTLLTIVTLSLICQTTRAVVSVVNGPVYNPANGHNYYLLSPATWQNAELFSQTLGGHLMTINDAAENTWMYNAFIASDPNLNPWIGLNDIGTPGVWKWASGETVSYLNFAPGEPNQIGPAPYGVNIFPLNPYPTFASKWNDAPTVDVIMGIAEVPEPTTFSLAIVGLAAVVLRRFRRG
jgi:hypothetical protein